jgi:uncharacterized membrane protein
MTAARFLYISGACFLLAAAFRFTGKWEAAYALYVPAIVFLVCGVIALVHNLWTSRAKSKS